jgi:hypothetical protein
VKVLAFDLEQQFPEKSLSQQISIEQANPPTSSQNSSQGDPAEDCAREALFW